ncbi:4-coumarate--CoA ligase-like 9 [Penaeus japonicus]|uniref:4-coumarate--CoA ligase-like 9 n=1 Tax=Penaeus japonicus TaxID=27405 RepID=UPI001C7139B2|nr:4-coumarate--CoA ligase-like 9 [Penaeus japonicus]
MLRSPASLLRRVLTRSRPLVASRCMAQSKRSVVTSGYEVHSPFPDIEPAGDVVSVILDTARRFGHHTAVECSVTGRSYTYAQLEDAAFRFAGLLQGMGVQRGDVVGVLAPNGPEYPVVFLGSMIAGAGVTCFNPTYTPGEIARQLSDSGTKVIVVDPLLEVVLDAALAQLKRPPKVVLAGKSSRAEGGRPNLQELARDEGKPFGEYVKVSERDLSVLGYSSGTTGVPKGARIDHGAVAYNLAMVLHPEVFPYRPTTAESQESVIGLMPFFHAWGMYGVMTCSFQVLGAAVVTMPQFIPEVFVKVIKQHQVGVLHLVPPLLQFLVAHPLVTSDDLASVRSTMCAAAPCPPLAAHAFKKKVPNKVFFQEVYGMTETMPTHFTPLNGAENIGSCGVLLPSARARVEDLTSGAPLPPGEAGELVIHTPALMSGYHGNEDATRDVMTADGWLRTGDVAKYDSEGYFYIVDRIKELIKVKGLQVSPTELEDELRGHPSVADVGVVGVADERAGEVPRAYVVRRSTAETGDKVKDKEEEDRLAEALQKFLSERVAPHKHLLGGVKFVEELPKNPTGKLLRRTLKEMAAEE